MYNLHTKPIPDYTSEVGIRIIFRRGRVRENSDKSPYKSTSGSRKLLVDNVKFRTILRDSYFGIYRGVSRQRFSLGSFLQSTENWKGNWICDIMKKERYAKKWPFSLADVFRRKCIAKNKTELENENVLVLLILLPVWNIAFVLCIEMKRSLNAWNFHKTSETKIFTDKTTRQWPLLYIRTYARAIIVSLFLLHNCVFVLLFPRTEKRPCDSGHLVPIILYCFRSGHENKSRSDLYIVQVRRIVSCNNAGLVSEEQIDLVRNFDCGRHDCFEIMHQSKISTYSDNRTNCNHVRRDPVESRLVIDDDFVHLFFEIFLPLKSYFLDL